MAVKFIFGQSTEYFDIRLNVFHSAVMIKIYAVVSAIYFLLLLTIFEPMSCSSNLGNCMHAVSAACEIISSNNRDCKVTCETPQQIGK